MGNFIKEKKKQRKMMHNLFLSRSVVMIWRTNLNQYLTWTFCWIELRKRFFDESSKRKKMKKKEEENQNNFSPFLFSVLDKQCHLVVDFSPFLLKTHARRRVFSTWLFAERFLFRCKNKRVESKRKESIWSCTYPSVLHRSVVFCCCSNRTSVDKRLV